MIFSVAKLAAKMGPNWKQFCGQISRKKWLNWQQKLVQIGSKTKMGKRFHLDWTLFCFLFYQNTSSFNLMHLLLFFYCLSRVTKTNFGHNFTMFHFVLGLPQGWCCTRGSFLSVMSGLMQGFLDELQHHFPFFLAYTTSIAAAEVDQQLFGKT